MTTAPTYRRYGGSSSSLYQKALHLESYLISAAYALCGAAYGATMGAVHAAQHLAPLLTSRAGLDKLLHGASSSASTKSYAYAKGSSTLPPPSKDLYASGASKGHHPLFETLAGQ